MTNMRRLGGNAIAVLAWGLLLVAPMVRGDAVPGGTMVPRCQILDTAAVGLYNADMTVLSDAEVVGSGDIGMVEFDGFWQFAYFGRFLGGSMGTGIDAGGVFLSTPDAFADPNQVIRLALDVAWTWRFRNGFAVQVGTRPGIYSDFEDLSGDSFYYPFSGALIYSFNDYVSGLAGLDVRPDYGRGLWPLVRLEWVMSPACRLRVGYPENRFTVFWNRRWRTYVGCDWRSDSYRLADDESHNLEAVTFEDIRAYGGIGYSISDELSLNVEGGTVMEREIAFNEIDGNTDDDFEIDDAVMVRVGISGPF